MLAILAKSNVHKEQASRLLHEMHRQLSRSLALCCNKGLDKSVLR